MKRLQNHRSRGTSGIRAGHLKGWLATENNNEKEEAVAKQDNLTEGRMISEPDRMGMEGTDYIREKIPVEDSNWDRVVDLVQTAFGEG